MLLKPRRRKQLPEYRYYIPSKTEKYPNIETDIVYGNSNMDLNNTCSTDIFTHSALIYKLFSIFQMLCEEAVCYYVVWMRFIKE